MSGPFHFPTEYGRLGNWPGSIGPNEAQALLIHAASHRPGAKFVELGFDGGRTTIVLHWAAQQIEGAKVFTLPVRHDETGLWFKRAQVLFKMDREQVTGYESLAPFAADLIVVQGLWIPEWFSLAPAGASLVHIGSPVPPPPNTKEILSQPGMTIWSKTADAAKAIDRAITSVVSEFSENKLADKAVVPLDSNQRAKIRSLRSGAERRRGGGSSDTPVHAPVAADEGAKLLPS